MGSAVRSATILIQGTAPSRRLGFRLTRCRNSVALLVGLFQRVGLLVRCRKSPASTGCGTCSLGAVGWGASKQVRERDKIEARLHAIARAILPVRIFASNTNPKSHANLKLVNLTASRPSVWMAHLARRYSALNGQSRKCTRCC